MQTLKTTQDYIENIDNQEGVKAVLFTQFQEPCSRCIKAAAVLKSIHDPAIPIFQFSAPADAYPLNKLGINTVPTLVILKNAKPISSLSGFDDDRMDRFYKEAIHVNY